ncbi:RteC domain-containing protein [Olivibacter sp. SDN3]|uniref:RteC domain-containing protein n=1 Tax=Olivibacter sp. SDN3 TaxID=2764720 RepID=UPI0016517B19|nr:RteC domain-containing protein [Olivibacter sp. SDN3]QNL48940.1 RteC domain-containing protein [Olivibacter sp. SDN3]
MHETLLAINEDIQDYAKKTEERYKNDYSKLSELSIQYISERLQWAKQKFEQNINLTADEEIFYFKHIKSHLLALIQYYALVQKVELKKPPLQKKKLKEYYLKALYKVKKKLRKRQFFYNYYKANLDQLDDHLFKRIDHDLFFHAGSYILDIDKRKSTPTLHIFAQVEAYEMLRHYLKRKIKSFGKAKEEKQLGKINHPLQWTTSKTDLIELIYALHAAGTFNNGKADIKEIAEYFQQVFDVELGQYNRVFYDIRARKTSKTKLLDNLKDALLRRIKETDNELFI